MTLPKKKPKGFIKKVHGFDTVSLIMDKFLNKWDVLHRTVTSKQFAELYWQKMIQKAMKGEQRMILPHNLGYIQALEHRAPNNAKKAHIMKFGMADYSLIWVKHPIFVLHTTGTEKSVTLELRKMKLNGAKFLNEYVDGDTYVT